MPEQLLTVKEIAVLSRMAEMTLRKLIWSGEIRSIRIGRSVRVRESDWNTWIEQNEWDIKKN